MTGRRHSRRRDWVAVPHHYDVPNEFYRLLPDKRMVYFSACFTDGGLTLEQPQIAKLELICGKLGLAEGMQLLDVVAGGLAGTVRGSALQGACHRHHAVGPSA